MSTMKLHSQSISLPRLQTPPALSRAGTGKGQVVLRLWGSTGQHCPSGLRDDRLALAWAQEGSLETSPHQPTQSPPPWAFLWWAQSYADPNSRKSLLPSYRGHRQPQGQLQRAALSQSHPSSGPPATEGGRSKDLDTSAK